MPQPPDKTDKRVTWDTSVDWEEIFSSSSDEDISRTYGKTLSAVKTKRSRLNTKDNKTGKKLSKRTLKELQEKGYIKESGIIRPMTEPPADISAPILPSGDLGRTAAFYRSLGFHAAMVTAEYLILRRGRLELHFTPMTVRPETNTHAAYLRVADIDGFHAGLPSAAAGEGGIPRLSPVADMPWGMRECHLIDPDGNLIRIGAVMAP